MWKNPSGHRFAEPCHPSSPRSLGFESRIARSFPSGLAPRCAAPPSDFLSKNKSLKTKNNHITYWLWRLSPFLSCVIPSFPVANNSTKVRQTRKHSETHKDSMEMRYNLFVDLLAHERNRYRRFLSADIKHYLSRITEKAYKVNLWACDAALFVIVLISQTLFFGLNVTLTLVFYFYSIVILSYDSCVFSTKC